MGVQDVVFRTDNVLFHKEKFYSPAQRTIYGAPLPPDYSGSSARNQKGGAGVYFGAQMSEPKVAELLRSVGVRIRWAGVEPLIKDQAPSTPRKTRSTRRGWPVAPGSMDDTSTRVNGQNG